MLQIITLSFKINCFNELPTSFYNPELIISICAIIVSLVGLLLTARYNRKTFEYRKNQDKKTTQPYITIRAEAVPESPIRISLRNSGFGPAIVNSIKFIYNNEISFNFFDLLFKISPEFEKNIDIKTITYLVISKETIVAANDELELINFVFSKGYNFETFYKFMGKLQTETVFKNIYDEKNTIIDRFGKGK